MSPTRLRAALLLTWIAFVVGGAHAQSVSRSVLTPEVPHTGASSLAFGGEESEGGHALFDAIGEGELTTGIVVGALALAFGLGALHSLSPGHGKTLVAAYLVGTRGTVGHAIALGGIVTVTHVFSVLILGLIALVAADYFVPEKLMPILGAVSGLLIVAVGLFMFRRAFRHRDDAAGEGHSHTHDHGDVRRSSTGEVTMGSLFALGVSGGMVPCPSALVVLLTAVALKRIALGLALVVVFSFGLAVVLMVIGVLLVTARGFTERFAGQGMVTRAAAVIPIVSATVVTAVGLVICWHSLLDAGKVFFC